MHTPSHQKKKKKKKYRQSYKRLYIFKFSTNIFSADITPEVLKLCRVTKVKVFFLVLVYVFNFDLIEFSAAILEKGLLVCGILFILIWKTRIPPTRTVTQAKRRLI